MNKKEAGKILEVKLDEIKLLGYGKLKEWVVEKNVEVFEITGPDGVEYQIEIQAFFDDNIEKDIRVLGSIDDGTLPASMFPVSSDFIISENGEIV